jgi:ABC-type spermidine/putrescine transport system permease subunit I
MDRRAYLISVFDDTLERINGDFELHKAQQQSIAAQKLILVVINHSFQLAGFITTFVSIGIGYLIAWLLFG